MPDLVDPLGDVGVVGALRGEHGGRVDHRAEVAEHAGRARADRRLDQPAQPALGECLDLRRRQPDLAVGQRAESGQLGQRVPLPRAGAAHPGGGQPGQLGRGRPAQLRRAGRVGDGAPQVRGQRGQRQPALARRGHVLDLDLVAGQLGQEPGRPVLAVLAADRGDDQAPPRPGDRDVEQPALLVEQLGAQRGRGRVGGGLRGPDRLPPHRRARPCRAASRAAAGRARCPPGRPATTTRSHSRPLAPVRGEHRDGIALRARSASVSPAISWPVRLSRNSRGEPGGSRALNRLAASNSAAPRPGPRRRPRRGCRPPRWPPARPRPGRRRPTRPRAPRARSRPPRSARPGRAARRPAARRRSAMRAPARRRNARRRPRRTAGRCRRLLAGKLPGRPARQQQLARVAQRRCQRVVAWRLARGLRRAAQRAAQPAQAERVRAAERPGEQLGGGLLVQRAGLQRAAQQRQQRPGPRLGGQRQLVAGDGHRDSRPRPARAAAPAPAGSPTGPAPPSTTRACRPSGGPGAACRRSTAASWLALAAMMIRTAPGSAPASGGQLAVPAFGIGGLRPERAGQPARYPAGRGQQDRAAAAAGAQRDHLRRAGRPARGTDRGTG